MKLLLVGYTTRNYFGGMETYMRHLQRGLHKRGVFVESIYLDDAVSPLRWKLIKLAALVQSLGRRDYYRVYAVQSFMNYLAKATKEKLEKFRPDLIHAQDISSAAAIAPFATAAGIPIAMTDPGGIFLKSEGKRYQALITRNKETAFRSVRAIICYTVEHMHAILVHQAPSVRFFVVPNAIDVDHFITSGRGENPFPVRPYILVVARLLPYKGIDIAIRAFYQVIKSHPEFRLVLAGEGPLYKELKVLTTSLRLEKSVFFLGAVPQKKLPLLYRDAEIVWVPSVARGGTIELFSIVSLEAMAFSKPIVVTKEGGPAEIFREGGAILVPPGDPDALAEATLEILRNPELAKKLGEEAGIIVRKRYNFDLWIDKMIKIYQEIITSQL